MDECDASIDQRDAFFVWLSGHISPAQLSELYVMADELDKYCIEKRFVKTSVFAISNRTSVARLRANLEGNRLFKFFNRRKMGRMLVVLKHYIEYLNTTENTVVENPPAITVLTKPTPASAPVTTPTSSPIVTNSVTVNPATSVTAPAPQPIQEPVWSDQAYAFRNYLISKGKSGQMACVQVRALICIDAFISKHSDEYDPLLEIKDYTQALQIVAKLLSDEHFLKLNRENSNLCMIAA